MYAKRTYFCIGDLYLLWDTHYLEKVHPRIKKLKTNKRTGRR